MNTIYVIILTFFVLIIFLLSYISSKNIKNEDDWMVADRSFGVFTSMGTYFSTIVSSVTIISYTGYIYLNGVSGIWVFSGTFLTSILSIAFYASRLRRTGKTTLPEYLSERFGNMEGLMGAILILFSSILLLCVQIIAGSSVFMMITGWNKGVCLIFLIIVLIILTGSGGMRSVGWTDTFCAYVMLIGVWVMAVKLITSVGGLHAIGRKIYEINDSYLDWKAIGWPMILSWIFTWGIGNFGAPQFVTRFFVTKDEKTAKRSQILCILGFILFYSPIALIGITGIIICPHISIQDDVLFSIMKIVENPWIGGLLMSALFASCISTADSVLLMASTTFVHDLHIEKAKVLFPDVDSVRASRIVTCIIAFLAGTLAFFNNSSLLSIQSMMVTIMGASIAPAVLIGLVWNRANKGGGLLSFMAGLLTSIVWYVLKQPFGLMPMIPAIVAGSLSMIIGTMIYEKWEKK